MKQEILTEQFSQTFRELTPKFANFSNNDEKKLEMAFFQDSESKRMAALISNDEFYYYDLGKRHQYEILGYNHPLQLKSELLAYSQNFNTQLILESYNIAGLFGDDLCGLVIGKERFENKKQFTHFHSQILSSSESFEEFQSQFNKTKKFYISINQEQYFVVTNQILMFEQEEIYNVSEYLKIYFTTKLFLKSNLLSKHGKINDLNSILILISNYFSDVQMKSPLCLTINHANSILHENLKQKGVLGELIEDRIQLYFPLTILEEELLEIFDILEQHLKIEE